MSVLVCVYLEVVSEWAPTQRLPTSLSLADWPEEGGERGTGADTTGKVSRLAATAKLLGLHMCCADGP